MIRERRPAYFIAYYRLTLNEDTLSVNYFARKASPILYTSPAPTVRSKSPFLQ